MNPVNGFKVEDIDGSEFVKSRDFGKILISWQIDFDGKKTGKVLVVYADTSSNVFSLETVQKRIDSGDWMILR